MNFRPVRPKSLSLTDLLEMCQKGQEKQMVCDIS